MNPSSLLQIILANRKSIWMGLFLFVNILLGEKANAQCEFTISNSSPCAEELIQFDVTTPSGIYSWDFDGDGTIDDFGESVNYFYPNSGSAIEKIYVTLYRDGVACPIDSVNVLPSPTSSIGLVSGSGTINGNEIRVCSGTSNATISVFNSSPTLATNVSYEIDWGDGSPTQTFDNTSFSPASFVDHTYTSLGYFNLNVTTTSVNACTDTETYVVYIGSNPSVGLVAPGTTVGACAPQSVTFPISGTVGNPTGTQYLIFVSDSLVASFTQDDIPSEFTYIFTESSCGVNTSTGQYDNAFDVRIVASNPCGSTQSTVEPIEVSTPPEAEFLIDAPTNYCVNEPFTFINNSTGINEIISGNPSTCETSLSPSWLISPGVPGVDWNILVGNLFNADEVTVEFLEPGDYTISMTVNSAACGADTYQTTISIEDEPTADAEFTLLSSSNPGTDECVNTTVNLTNRSTGPDITTTWVITPNTGFTFLNGTDLTTQDLDVEFTEANNYTVSLLATNTCATDVWETDLSLADEPIVVFDPIPNFCENATLNFDASNISFDPSGGTISSFDWSFPGATPSTSSDQYPSNISYSTPGNYTVSLTTTNQCGSVITTTNFSIQTPGIITLENDTSFCLNDPLFTLSPLPIGGQWTGLGVSNSGIFTPANANIGDNTLIYTYQDGVCTLVDSMVITIQDLPTVEAGNNEQLCIYDAPFLLTGATPSGGTWSVNNGGVITSSNFFDPMASGANVYTLTYSYEDAVGCTNTDTRTITVHNRPVIEAGMDQSICDNPFDYTLTGFSPNGGTWTGTGVSSDGIFNAANTPGIGNYKLFYTFTDPITNCNNIDSMIMSVTFNEVANAGQDDTLCVNEAPFEITTGLPTGGTWTGPGTSTGNIFDAATAGVGSHILTYTSGVGVCQTTDTKIIRVIDIPSLSIISDQDICINEASLDLSSATPNGGTWSGDGVTGSSFNPSMAGVGNHSLTYSYADPISNCTNTASVDIEVRALPSLSANDTTLCNIAGLTDLPYATPVGGTWSGIGVNGNQFDPSLTTGAGSYLLEYRYTDGFSCTDTISINLTLIDPQTIEAGTDQTFCESDSNFDLSLNASPTGGTWSINTSSGLNGNQFSPSDAGVGIHTLTYTIGVGNCQVFDSISIEVLALPVVEAGNDLEICFNDTPFDLSGFSPNGGTWIGTGITDATTGTFNPIGLSANDYKLYYQYTDASNCFNQDSLVITIHPLPIVDAGSDTTYCFADVIEQLPTPNPTGGVWSGQGITNTDGEINPSLLAGAGNYTLYYSFTEPLTNCVNTDSINVEIQVPVTIDAGINDTLCWDQGLYNLAPITPNNGRWDGPGIVDAENGIFDPSIGAGVYELTYHYGTGSCYVEDTRQVIVVDLSFVSAGQDESVCFNAEPIVLDDQFPLGGTWSGPGILDGTAGTFDPSQAGTGTHNITYTYIDNFSGCIGRDLKEVEVYPVDPPEFDLPVNACVGEPIDFINQSNTLYTALWEFGDGNISNSFNPRHVYTEPNTYSIKLTIRTADGCVDSIRHNIFVTERPIPYFVPDTTEACVGLEIGLNNQSFGYDVSYSWNFGNGQESTEDEPNLQYFDQGTNDTTYIVTLAATNLCGTNYYQDTIRIHPIPVMDFGVSPESECSPVTYSFSNTSVGSPDTYFWDFGNGNTFDEAAPEPQEYYTDSLISFYDIELIGTNECGADTIRRTVEVAPSVVQAFFNVSTLDGCQPLEVDFYNFATPGAVIDWDFGDGNSSSDSEPTHIFTEPGTYSVVQYAGSPCGYDSIIVDIVVRPAPEVNFTHPTYVCQGDAIDFSNLSVNTSGHLWDFGDGDSSLLNNPSHVYDAPGTYQVTLTGISNFNQCPDIYTSEVIVRGLPTAAFVPSENNGCMPMEVNFDNQSTNSQFYQWDFGDGNNAVSSNPTHTFLEAGNYEVKLMATDDFGCSNDSTLLNILVHPRPNAAFNIERDRLCGLPVQIALENESTDAGAYQWNFGDGNTTVLNNPQHQYNEANTFEITLSAENQFGCTHEAIQEITAYEMPEANFEVDQVEGCTPLTVRFANRSNFANQFYWDFGNGLEAFNENPNNIFTESGSYDVMLISSMDNVCFDTLVQTSYITAHPTPFAEFQAVETESSPHSGTYRMYNFSLDATNYYWEFGDGNTSDVIEPTHRYFTNGFRQIYLEASNDFGCVDDTLLTFEPEFFKGLFLPNAFSPESGIGEATVFLPKGVGLEEYHVQVFSPYGQLLWESTEIKDGQPAASWDGTHHGALLPQDVYVWKCAARFGDGTVWPGQKNKKGRYEITGSVILLR